MAGEGQFFFGREKLVKLLGFVFIDKIHLR